MLIKENIFYCTFALQKLLLEDVSSIMWDTYRAKNCQEKLFLSEKITGKFMLEELEFVKMSSIISTICGFFPLSSKVQ